MGGFCRASHIYISICLKAVQVDFKLQPLFSTFGSAPILHGSDRLLIGCIYRSPSNDIHPGTESLCDSFRSVVGYSSHLLICENFNYCNINWPDPSNLTTISAYSQSFLDMVQDLFLHQHVSEPTRYSIHATPHVLDLVFTNKENMLTNVHYLTCLGNSDHVSLYFNLICYAPYDIHCSHCYNLNRADFSGVKDWLDSFDWVTDFDSFDIVSMWNCFSDRFTEALNKFVSILKSRRHKSIFMNRNAFTLHRQKNHLWRKY